MGLEGFQDCLFLDVYERILPFAFYLVIVRDYTSTMNSMVMLQQRYTGPRISINIFTTNHL